MEDAAARRQDRGHKSIKQLTVKPKPVASAIAYQKERYEELLDKRRGLD